MTSFKYLLISFVLTLSACGGGSSSGGSGGELGRCEFTVDGNNVPQVTISISTSDQSVEQEIRTACGRALSSTRNVVRNCLTSPTTPAMYPTAIRTKDKYILERRSSNGSGEIVIQDHVGSAEELPIAVANSVISVWMFEQGLTSFPGCS